MIFYIRIINFIKTRFFRLFFSGSFRSYGRRSFILSPIAIEGSENIEIGDDVYVAAKTCLATKLLPGSSQCTLRIGSGSKIGRFNHIYCTSSIVIGENVLTANGVYISDNNHDYREIGRPIMNQHIIQIAPVIIGSGSWLGQNVAVIGASVGRNCVIAANSVVTRDIPDYCVAAGAPATIIKRFDVQTGQWLRVD
jgi:acetyltransferase-like isoleucine patch superfamily enzyme